MSLTAAEIASMRGTADDFLPDLCTIQFAVSGQDSMGGVSITYPTSATGIACRMDEPVTGGAEQSINLAVGAAVKFIAHLKHDQTISVKDRVVYGSNTYEVAEVLDTASWLMTRRIALMRIE